WTPTSSSLSRTHSLYEYAVRASSMKYVLNTPASGSPNSARNSWTKLASVRASKRHETSFSSLQVGCLVIGTWNSLYFLFCLHIDQNMDLAPVGVPAPCTSLFSWRSNRG